MFLETMLSIRDEGFNTELFPKEIPANMFLFFSEYFKNWGIYRRHFEALRPVPQKTVARGKTALFFSGGSESLLNKALLDDVGEVYDLITLPPVNYFYSKPHPYLKDEFYYLTYAASLGYTKAVLGLESVPVIESLNDKWYYEFTPGFFALWEDCFGLKVESPVLEMTKIQVYQELFKRGFKESDIYVCPYYQEPVSWKGFEKAAICAYLSKQPRHFAAQRFIDLFRSNAQEALPYLDPLTAIDKEVPLEELFL